jgi:hypothetical protein
MRLAIGLVPLAALIAATGCLPETDPPTHALVVVRISSETPGLAKGARVMADDLVLTDSLSTDQIELPLRAGLHKIVVHKDCVEVTPAETLTVAVEAEKPLTCDFHLRLKLGIQVDSDPSGMPIWLDGARTGEVTPAALTCVSQGDHVVRISPYEYGQTGYDVRGDTIQAITLGGETADARFDLTFTPRPQSRGVLFEIFTSTYCPNCGPADHAATELDNDPAFGRDRLSVVQVHLWWMGLDPLYNETLGARADFYRIEPSTSPHAFFNGRDKVTGTMYADIRETYRSKIMNTYGQPGVVGLYWIDPRVEGNRLEGRLRYIALEDLSAYTIPELSFFYAKDSLRITDPAQNPNNLDYVQGSRTYSDPIDLTAAGMLAPGRTMDIDVAYDLSIDHLPAFIDESASSLRLIAVVQDRSSREILQCRQVRIRRN